MHFVRPAIDVQCHVGVDLPSHDRFDLHVAEVGRNDAVHHHASHVAGPGRPQRDACFAEARQN